MKKRYYILIGVLSYLAFTLANVPASKIISLAKKNTDLPVNIYGTYGSLWNGGADKMMLQNSPDIDNLHWSINPAYMLLAQISGEIKASINKQNIIGQVNIGPTGELSAKDVRARMDASSVQELLQLPLGELGGTFIIDIASISGLDKTIPVIDANIKWQSANLTLAETLDLGHINMTINPDSDDQLKGTILNTKGQVTLDGKFTLNNNKSYSIDLRLVPQKSATENIRQSLGMFARRQNDGSYLLKKTGNLNEFGI